MFFRPLLTAASLSLILTATATPLSAAERSGKEIVDTVCAGCHTSGKDGAPKIDDRAAWAERAAKGLDKLTENAIAGVRKMPAHGGQAALSDLEMSRAVAYMVSGGAATEPRKPLNTKKPMSGEKIVEERCQSCHATGTNGAPKLGDSADWNPRLSGGVDRLVKSATQGHKSMPARGGLANLSDKDMKAAVEYMLAQLGKR